MCVTPLYNFFLKLYLNLFISRVGGIIILQFAIAMVHPMAHEHIFLDIFRISYGLTSCDQHMCHMCIVTIPFHIQTHSHPHTTSQNDVIIVLTIKCIYKKYRARTFPHSNGIQQSMPRR